MRLAILILLCFIPILVSPKSDMRVFYVSSSSGNDANEGSKKEPKRSIWSITKLTKDNLVIKLKRGDVFYENIHHLSNVRIEAYGKGEKPILCGFRILRYPIAWKSVEDGVWSLNLNNDTCFTGFPRCLSSNSNCYNNIGCIYNPCEDKIYGHMVSEERDLLNDGDFFVSSVYKKAEVKANTFGQILFKSKYCPQEMGKLCFSVFEHGISNIKNGVIRDIAIVGFAKHGMCNLINCEVSRCELDIIGGAIQIGTSHYIRYGNGIEFWIENPPQAGNSIVKNCTISRTYDCGATIQGRKGVIKDVTFKNNKFIFCRQAFEHFITDKDASSNYVRCSFTENLVYGMGNNQFSSPEGRDGNLLSYGSPNKNLTISNNIFWGANHYDGQYFANSMKGNRIYIYEGQKLCWCHYIEKKGKIMAGESEKYRTRTGDLSKVFVLGNNSQKEHRLEKKLLRKIGFHKHNLKVE